MLTACNSPIKNKADKTKTKPESFEQFAEISKYSLKIDYSWTSGPYSEMGRSNTLVVKVYNKDFELTNLPKDYKFKIYSTMPKMGHPMHKAGEFKLVQTGYYINEGIVFTMGGQWEHEIILINDNSETMGKITWQEFL